MRLPSFRRRNAGEALTVITELMCKTGPAFEGQSMKALNTA